MDFRGRNIDLVGKLSLWFGLSLAFIVIGLGSLAAFGLNLGIDFKGGGQLQYRIPAAQRPAPGQDVALLGQVRQSLEQKGLEGTKIQVAGGDTLVIQTSARNSSELSSQERLISSALASQWKLDATQNASALQPLSRELVGPVIGRELRDNAIKGVFFGVVLIALWIYIRYNFSGGGVRYAVAGIVALLHDVVVLIGLFALIGHFDPRIELDGAFIAALLTVVGYSINDSVVIFDRIRENLRNRRREPFNKVVNDSLLETMSRSINTGMTVIIMLFVLLLFGGEGTYTFVLAMLLGIISGLYSSIFNASMVLVGWHNWEEKKALEARGARTTAASSNRPLSGGETRRPGLAASTLPSSASTLSSSAPTPTSSPVRTESEIVPPSAQPSTSSDGEAGSKPTRPAPPQKARAKRRY
jgi:preprotein translocase subunit SecF